MPIAPLMWWSLKVCPTGKGAGSADEGFKEAISVGGTVVMKCCKQVPLSLYAQTENTHAHTDRTGRYYSEAQYTSNSHKKSTHSQFMNFSELIW